MTSPIAIKLCSMTSNPSLMAINHSMSFKEEQEKQRKLPSPKLHTRKYLALVQYVLNCSSQSSPPEEKPATSVQTLPRGQQQGVRHSLACLACVHAFSSIILTSMHHASMYKHF